MINELDTSWINFSTYLHLQARDGMKERRRNYQWKYDVKVRRIQ
jgi:hypothetical protein